MTDTLISKAITHIWPGNKLVNPDAQPFSNERESDVWDEVRELTYDNDARGGVAVLLHTGCAHEDAKETFTEEIVKDHVVISNVKFFAPRELESEIYHPEQPERTVAFRRPSGEIVNPTTIPLQPAHTETIKEKIPFHLGSRLDADEVIRCHRKGEIGALVLRGPDESEHLKYLPKVTTACPDLPIYIFHSYYREDRWGVERESGCGGSLWDTQSDILNDKELQPLIEHVANVQENTWIFGPPKHGKTWIMLSVVKALLTGEPLFGVSDLKVPNISKRLIYLCPEAGRAVLRKRLNMIGLTKFLYDPISNPVGRLYLRSLSMGPKLNLDDPRLLELARESDIFIDTAVRYVDGDENSATDVKDMTEKILNLLALGARSSWVAHHSGKTFASATEITLENCARGSTEFAASLTNAIGIVQLDKDTNHIHVHYIDGRDMDEPMRDLHLTGRPYLYETGNFKVTENVDRFKGRNPKAGPKSDPDKQAKIDFAKTIPGSLQKVTDEVNKQFGSKHSKSTMSDWLKQAKFDSDLKEN